MKITSTRTLENFGRVQLSKSFYMREMLYSEVANFHGMPNFPEFPDLAIEVGKKICTELLEPLQERFGRIAIRSAYRSPTVNGFCSDMQRAGKAGYACGSNASNYAGHIWDYKDAKGHMGGTVCIVIPSFAQAYNAGEISWRELAWWIHDNLPYSKQTYFPINAAFNLTWNEEPERHIMSYIAPTGTLTKPGMANFGGNHASDYPTLRAQFAID